jgi:hypothetical protein
MVFIRDFLNVFLYFWCATIIIIYKNENGFIKNIFTVISHFLSRK